jgi:hypothetical protein
MGLPQSRASDVLDAITGRGSYATYLALMTGDPGVDPSVADVAALEPAATGYARAAVSWAAPVWDVTDAYTDNSADIELGPFPDVTGLDEGVTHLALVTSASGTSGTVRHVWTTPADVIVPQDEYARYLTGDLVIRQEV